MGIFNKKKKKTEVATDVTEKTLQKIVKLSYIQSIAINGGLIDPRSLVETKGSTEKLNSSSTDKNAIEKLNSFGGSIDPVGKALGLNKLFGGKKVSRDSSVTIEDTGWTLVRTWLQPEFDVIRYALGLRELAVAQFTYLPVSEIVSKPWQSPKEIVKATLIVDQFIPPQFPPGVYIEYYIKPDVKDVDWTRINPLGTPSQFLDNGNIVPRIISFNCEKSVSSRLEESYVNTEAPVKSVRFKAVLRRPESMASFTPVLRSYRFNLSLRNGL